uniref:RuBisCO large subunit-binding protein subunit beta, chloroplastic (Fragments) n=1 Tax=Populus euphratica TaxID=75702 RepID=RUBB_POPEU|nr:RecName: Full=RuBisCO large subunit-binding protein subunit beta, chloroplastic; AltName: Full=60 kDa chaperonin subunit beta; AltName: Full=CPN-60 beta [Populus euphratica]
VVAAGANPVLITRDLVNVLEDAIR